MLQFLNALNSSMLFKALMLIVESAFHLSVLVSENSKAHAIRDLLEYTYTTTRAVSTKQSITEYIYMNSARAWFTPSKQI